MKIKFLNNSARNQRFQYNPMYYDERKIRLAKKKEQYEELNAADLSDERRKEIFKENIKGEWNRTQYRKNQTSSSNIRVLLLIGAILALGYFVFNGVDEVDTVVKNLW